MEENTVAISRLNSCVKYPCNFIFVASMNPCPCGYYGSKEKKCTCKPMQIKNYINKISGPLLDRIDIHIEVGAVKYEKLRSETEEEMSSIIKNRVNIARKKQLQRYEKYKIFSNSELTNDMLNNFCKLNQNSKKILKRAFEKLGLSARAYGKILKVARTIADLDSSDQILEVHLAEAIQYRTLDRKYWNR